MVSINDVDGFLAAVSHRILSRYGGTQIFLFGPQGEPFWAARLPVRPEESHQLSQQRALE